MAPGARALSAANLVAMAVLAVIVAATTLAPATLALATAQPDDTAPPEDVTIDTANPFIPEERDLTECIGMLQRPGCGSEARGGWHQNAVAIAMIGGLAIVFGRVAYGVRKNRQRSDTAP